MKNKKVSHLKSDIISGFIISMISLPLCLGISLASGTPLYSGFISGIVGGFVVGLLSDSSLSVSGPAAGLTSIVILSMTKLKVFDVFLCVVLVAGFFQILFGVLKLGFLSNYLPSNVIKGMLSGIGFMIIKKHISYITGVSIKNLLLFIFQNKSLKISLFNAIIGTFSIFILMFWNKKIPKKITSFIPSGLIVIVLSTFLSKIICLFISKNTKEFVDLPIFNSFLDFMKNFIVFPNFNSLKNITVWKMGFVLSLISSIETLISIEAVDKIDPYKRYTSRNKELCVQGIGNMVSGLLGGLPLTSVVLRSSANLNAGCKSKFSTIFHGFLIFIFISLLPTLINNIPLSSLGALLTITGFKLCDPFIFIDFWKKGKIYFIPFFVTFLLVIISDLLTAVLIGVLISSCFIIYNNIKNPFGCKIFESKKDNKKYLYLHFCHYISFLNKVKLEKILNNIPNNMLFIIDASNCLFVDIDILLLLQDFKKNNTLLNKNIKMSFIGFTKFFKDDFYIKSDFSKKIKLKNLYNKKRFFNYEKLINSLKSIN